MLLATLFTLLAAVTAAAPVEDPALEKRQAAAPITNYIRPVAAPCGERLHAAISRDLLTDITNGRPLFLTPGGRYIMVDWVLPPSGQGQIKLYIAGSAEPKCIDAGSNPANGIALKVWDCFDVPQQQWKVYNGRIELVGYNLCMDVTEGQLRENTPLQTWECYAGNMNQQFYTPTFY